MKAICYYKAMKNLVIAVSPDSSLELLKNYADVVVLDKEWTSNPDAVYDTVYIRSHFSQPSTLPQNFRKEIDRLVQDAKRTNPAVKFIDSMDNVDAIVACEDKWLQYKTFGQLMPHTELYDDDLDISHFVRPIFKNRLSSRGSGVTWNREKVIGSEGNWIVQESLDIQEELRIYIIFGEVYPVGAVKRSMTEAQKAESANSRHLTQDEIDFSLNLIKQAPGLDIVGIDAARASDGSLYLMEVNRSPGFAKFHELTGANLADMLYG
jgi:hypothetical protein